MNEEQNVADGSQVQEVRARDYSKGCIVERVLHELFSMDDRYYVIVYMPPETAEEMKNSSEYGVYVYEGRDIDEVMSKIMDIDDMITVRLEIGDMAQNYLHCIGELGSAEMIADYLASDLVADIIAKHQEAIYAEDAAEVADLMQGLQSSGGKG